MNWLLILSLVLLIPAATANAEDVPILDCPLHGSLSSGTKMIGVPGGFVLEKDGLLLDGTGAWLATDTNLPTLRDVFTIECRVNPAERQRPYADILGNHENKFKGFAIQQESSQDNRYYFTYGTGTAWVYSPLFELKPNHWQHIAIVKTKDRLRVYIDGLLISATRITDPLVPGSSPFMIGLGIEQQPRWFSGRISDIKVWDTPRSFRSNLPVGQLAQLFERNGRVESVSSARWGLFKPDDTKTIAFSIDPESVPSGIDRIRITISASDENGRTAPFPSILNLDRKTEFTASVKVPSTPGYRKIAWLPTFENDGGTGKLFEGTLHYCVLETRHNGASARKERGVTKPTGWTPSSIVSLNGDWLIATDGKNEGREHGWYEHPRREAVTTRVPWIIQDAFTGYHGVAWYWRQLDAAPGPAGSRRLIRFEAVDYLADVWLNGKHVGFHEGGETPFVVDVTDAVQIGPSNTLAVRVLNPSTTPIDGMTLAQTPHRAKCLPYTAGGSYDHGGIVGSVHMETVPAIRVEDVQAIPDPAAGAIKLKVRLVNGGTSVGSVFVEATVAPAASGETVDRTTMLKQARPGDTYMELELLVPKPRRWDINDPYLYRVSVRAVSGGLGSEFSTRIGFRDFHLERGYFRLNGRRVYIRSSHTVNATPVGQQVPSDPSVFRRDITLMKAMGFNMIRFIWGGATREQLDACDEIGLMALVEHSASNPMEASPNMERRFDQSIGDTIKLHRNHPSVVVWGLLNETFDGPVFRHAVGLLPLVRALDPTRVVMLNSGRWDGRRDIGSVCNPNSAGWDGYLGGEGPQKSATGMSGPGGYTVSMGDVHAYPRVPHTADTINGLATFGKEDHPIFLSEYGIGSAVDLWRITRTFEQIGKPDAEDARFYRERLDRFMADWERWKLADCFGGPEDFFKASLTKMAGQRELGLNAIRANPNLLGHSVTGMMDHVNCGEGLFTLFRELKPGTIDALSECWAPLRLCLFAEPANGYSGVKTHLKAVLANEDVLKPGDYPVLLRILGPGNERLYEKTVNVKVTGVEEPFAIPFFDQEISLKGPAGRYRFTATIMKGGAPTGGKSDFYRADPSALPLVHRDIALFGEDRDLAQWLVARGARIVSQDSDAKVILATGGPLVGDPDVAWQHLKDRVEQGATAIFLVPQSLAKGEDAVGRLPLKNRGSLTPVAGWLYLKDEWSKTHPYFDGLPSGCLMDYCYYREIIPDMLFMGQDPPDEAVAGAIKASQDYSSGLMLSVYKLGKGRLVLNTLLIRENLGQHPAADKLLVNLLNRE